MIKRKINFPIKLVISGLIIFMTLFFIIGYLVKTLNILDYFNIKYVTVGKGQEGIDFSYLIGRNIFNLDLNKESRYISELYPAYKKVRLIRILPDRLFVNFTERKPLAYVKLYRYFYVDSDLVLIDAPGGLGEADLPIIFGLETKISGVKSGKRYNIKELALALNIIKESQINNSLKNYQIKRIDVANPANASCFMMIPPEPSDYTKGPALTASQVLEVKIGQSDISDKMRILTELLIQLKSDLDNIKYIDLRFREPVIKFRYAK